MFCILGCHCLRTKVEGRGCQWSLRYSPRILWIAFRKRFSLRKHTNAMQPTGIFMLFILFLGILVIDGSCPPILLAYKARRLRLETDNWALHAQHEEWDISV